MAAAPAQAQIESGQYWYGLWKLPSYEFVSSEAVTIKNGWMRGNLTNLQQALHHGRLSFDCASVEFPIALPAVVLLAGKEHQEAVRQRIKNR